MYLKCVFLHYICKENFNIRTMRFLYAFAALLVNVTFAFAQTTLTGTVSDAMGQPLPGVTVAVLDGGGRLKMAI